MLVLSGLNFPQRAVAFPFAQSIHIHSHHFALVWSFKLLPVTPSPRSLGFPTQARRRRLSCCKWRRQARGSNCITCKKIGFLAIPVIFLQVVQLLSQACCLPLPELLNMKHS